MSGVSPFPSTTTPGGTQALPDDERREGILEKIYAKLGEIIDDVVIVSVTTVVGTVTAANVGDVRKPTVITVAPEDQVVAHSSINTALGDMNIVLSKGFVDDAALMEQHKQALADSRNIRKESIATLQSAIQAIMGKMGG